MSAPIVVVADPAWLFGDKLPGKTRGASSQYTCMTAATIGPFIGGYCTDMVDAVLFCWRVAAMQEEALRAVREAGFTVKSELIWEKLTKTGKPHFGMGRYVRASHEVCLIAARGRAFPEARNIRSRFSAQVREHSRKPEEFYALVEQMYPSSEKHELFSRTVRAGWRQHGNELGRFKAAV